LEAATSRLEDLAVANTNFFREAHAQRDSAVSATSVGSAGTSTPKGGTPQFNTSVFNSDPRPAKEETIPEEPVSPVLVDYERIIKDLVKPWVEKCEKIGTVVKEQVLPP
jgi:hypothetical protein